MPGNNFCVDCGDKLNKSDWVEPSINADELPVPIPSAGERRQVTVLFCDIVGYTELSASIDAEVLQEIVRAYEEVCQQEIVRFEGYLYQRVGDGIVAFFGYPRAHEAAAERAVQAALNIIDVLANKNITGVGHLRVRIGIATGIVVTSGTEIAAFGDTLNLAARLQHIASPACVVINEQVRKLIGGAFSYDDLGETSLKGLSDPVRVYRITGIGTAPSRFDAAVGEKLTHLVGREPEISLLLKRWRQVRKGNGHVVLITGEPGIGKSRVLNVVREAVEQEGTICTRLQCSPYYTNTAYYPGIANFERLFDFKRDEPVASKLDKIEDLVVNRCNLPLSSARFVASMLSIPHEFRYGKYDVTPQKFKQETFRTLIDLLSGSARRAPGILIFEDAHWADPTSLDVLDQLVNQVTDIPLLIIITFRSEFANRWAASRQIDLLTLSRLSGEQSHAIVDDLVDHKSLPPGLAEQIVERGDGVPLFVEELTKGIMESGELNAVGDRFEYVGSSSQLTVPATLRDSLMARLDHHLQVKEIAQIGAAIGRSFRYELISAVALISKVVLDDALNKLIDSGLAYASGTPPDVRYTFKHNLVQDAAYDSLLKSRRQELHATISRIIRQSKPEAGRCSNHEVIAYHLTEAGDLEAATASWLQAGERDLAAMVLKESILHLQKGLSLIPSLPGSMKRDRLELALRRTLGVAWMASKGWGAAEVRESLLPGLSLLHAARSGKDVLPVYWGLWSNTLSQGRVADSAERAHEMLAYGLDQEDNTVSITASLMMCVSTFWMGHLCDSYKRVEEVRDLYNPDRHHHIANEVNHDPLTGAGVYGAQISWMLGYPDKAVKEYYATVEHAASRGHIFDHGFALAAGADIFEYRGEPGIQLEQVSACIEMGKENSLPVLSQLVGPLRRGAALIRAGRYEQGTALLHNGLQMREAAGAYGGSNPYLQGLLAEGLAKQGKLADAQRIIDAQIEQIERPGWGERCHYPEILRLQGWIFTLQQNHESAERRYIASLDSARKQGVRSWELRTSTSLARLLLGLHRAEEARQLLRPVYDSFTEGFDTKDLRDAKSLLEELVIAK